jgi:lipid II:glycine glycyltransferase (peptidoglycan interpeptide bridge formation enzyme)
MERVIKIERIDEKDYKNFVDNFETYSFLQDYEWGEVEKILGREVIRYGIYYDENLIGTSQIIGYKAKRGNFLLIPHGPLIKKEYYEKIYEIIEKIIEKIKEEKLNKHYIFLRLNSGFLKEDVNLEKFKKIGFNLAPIWTVSENFWIKDIDKNEEDLLSEMDKSHKKLILDSLDKDFLEIEETEDLNKIDDFWKIYESLANRKNFVPYPYELIKNEFEIFSKIGKAKLYFGKIEEKYYSSALIIFSHNSAFYHHGASLPIKEPINYKLHWKIILDAKNRGCKFYNMWGVTLSNDINHPWYGLTQFKKGFGGKLIKLLETLDYKFSKKYYITYIYEKIRRFKRRL